MQAIVQPIFTWSQDQIFAGEARDISLLVEWRGGYTSDYPRRKSNKIVARDIHLQLWLEPQVTLTGWHGCRVEERDAAGRTLLLDLGKLHAGQRKYIGLDFAIEAMPAGLQDILWLQWRYKQPPGERIRELPMQKLDLEYSHHTRVLGGGSNFYVEKHIELLKMVETVEQAESLLAEGHQPAAREQLRRHGDKLLLLAARSGDMQLLREAEKLYKLSAAEASAHFLVKHPEEVVYKI